MITLDYRYIYFLGSLILFAPYLLIIWKRKDLRKFILPLSLITLPFEIAAEGLFFRDYWWPPAVFELEIIGIRLLLSDVLFGLTVPFIMTFLLPFCLNLCPSRTIDIRKFAIKLFFNHLVVTSLWFIITIFLRLNSIISVTIGTTLFSIYVLFRRRDLIKIYVGSLAACALGALVFYYIFQLLIGNDYLYSVWLLDHEKYGLLLFGIDIPITEIMFAALVGPFYGILVPFLGNFRYNKTYQK